MILRRILQSSWKSLEEHINLSLSLCSSSSTGNLLEWMDSMPSFVWVTRSLHRVSSTWANHCSLLRKTRGSYSKHWWYEWDGSRVRWIDEWKTPKKGARDLYQSSSVVYVVCSDFHRSWKQTNKTYPVEWQRPKHLPIAGEEDSSLAACLVLLLLF